MGETNPLVKSLMPTEELKDKCFEFGIDIYEALLRVLEEHLRLHLLCFFKV